MFVKIFSQIFDSTLAEDYQTRHIFMDLLVLADLEGRVDMTLEAIHRRLNIPIKIVRDAIGKLCKPDPGSRTQNDDGRRLVPLDSERAWGWQIVNFKQYREMRDENAKREYMRTYMQRRRAEERARKDLVSLRKPQLGEVGHAEADVEADAEAVKKTPAAAPPGFGVFWTVYPRKVGKKAAQKAWDRATDKPDLPTLLAALEAQKRSDRWTKEGGQFIPNPATWLNQGRWADEAAFPSGRLIESWAAARLEPKRTSIEAILQDVKAARKYLEQPDLPTWDNGKARCRKVMEWAGRESCALQAAGL